MPNHIPGRHRAPCHLFPVTSPSTALARSTKPAVKVAAVLAVSGGMVAAFALPAGANPLADTAGARPQAAGTAAEAAAATAAVAVAAPSAKTTLAAPAFGAIGFTGAVKPKPLPQVNLASRAADEVRVTESRSSSRTQSRASRTQSRASRSTVRSVVTTLQAAPQRSEAPAASGVLGIAASLVGIYYVYGGTTPAGFDCSGFTQYVFGRAGISLPRTAEAQRQASTPVSNPQPGDLVFVGAPAYHVGIYAGGGMMYDSPRTGKAVSKRAIWSSSATYRRP